MNMHVNNMFHIGENNQKQESKQQKNYSSSYVMELYSRLEATLLKTWNENGTWFALSC